MGRASTWGGLLVVLAACGGGGAVDSGGPVDMATVDAPAVDGGGVCLNDVACSDGVYCNGAERCAPAAAGADAHGCVHGAAPCTVTETRDEAASTCHPADCSMPDADGDGHRSFACSGDDCDDADPNRYPGNPEVCDTAGHDEDCNPSTFSSPATHDGDRDGDGHVSSQCCNTSAAGLTSCGDDCDDVDRTVAPTSPEVCDGLDNNCDGMVDEGVTVPGFVDADGDLHGDPLRPTHGCAGLAGLSPVGDDCDDTDPSKHPGQPEVCNLRDDDCDGVVDNGTVMTTWYADTDGDGFGSASGGTRTSCIVPAGYSVLSTDCDDTDPHVHPGAAEICDAKDDDCDGRANYRIGVNDFEDDDGDHYADAACAVSAGDCNDRDPAVHPGAPEIGMDGVDENCDMHVDEVCTSTTWYVDADGDGWGDSTAATVASCSPQAGHVTRAGDCDDTNPARSPSAIEICNGVDDNCNGATDEGANAACGHDRALFVCTAGGCSLALCELGRADCNTMASDGCETSLIDDPGNCATCGHACPFGTSTSLPTCAHYTCAITCATDLGDCDHDPTNGCEVNLTNDDAHCGDCTSPCPARPHATPVCASSACALGCDAGYADCDAVAMSGCETHTDRDPMHCGRCSTACTTGQICVSGTCQTPTFASTGSDGAYAPTSSTVLSPGVHNFTTIDIPASVVITTNGSGVLDLRASGDVHIAGTIDVSGGRGGTCGWAPPELNGAGGGGATGNPLAPGYDWITTDPACMGLPGAGGGGANGAQGPGAVGSGCALGGAHGGGMGASVSVSGGGGGGGYAGGGGGAQGGNLPGGDGASSSGGVGGTHGGAGPMGCDGAQGGHATVPYGGGTAANGCPGPGGGGSIGAPAAADLAVATTFQTGSGGGGAGMANNVSGAGGGGGGGAVRIASATSVSITSTGSVLANGGAGGVANPVSGGAGGGGGSGGLVYLAAPTVTVDGTISALGGPGGAGCCGAFTSGGPGGLGRIRVSAVIAECSVSGSVDPPLVGALCAVSSTPGNVYVGMYPN